MKTLKLRLPGRHVLILFFCAVASSAALADRAGSRKIDAEETEIELTREKFTLFDQQLARVKLLRDGFDKDVVTKMTAWYGRAHKLADRYEDLIRKTDNQSPDELKITYKRDAILNKLTELTSGIINLFGELTRIRAQSGHLMAELVLIEDDLRENPLAINAAILPDGADPSVVGNIAALNSGMQDQARIMRATIAAVLENFDRRNTDSLTRLHTLAKTLVNIIINEKALTFPELEALVNEVDSIFTNEERFGNLASQVDAAGRQCHRLLIDNRVFAAGDCLGDLEQLKNKNLAVIEETNTNSAFKAAYRKIIVDAARRVLDIYTENTAGEGKAGMVFKNYKQRVLIEAPNHCKPGFQDFTINCQLARQVWGLRWEDFVPMNDEMLRYMEETVENILKGPLAGGADQ